MDDSMDDSMGKPMGKPMGNEKDDEKDEAFERLEAADPAADTELRTGVLRAKVDDLRSQSTHEHDEPGTGGTVAGGDVLAERRAARRRRGAWLVAAGVAGAVAIGGGGYVLGGATAGTPLADGAANEAAGGAEPAITLGDGGSGTMGGAAEDSAAAGDAGGRAMAESGAAADMAYPAWYSGRALFTADGLGTARGEAEAFALDAREVTTEDAVRRLAEALGVEGDPKWSYGSWSVGSQDGTSKSLYLSVDGNAYFSLNDPEADPWRCESKPADDSEAEPATGEEGCATAATASKVSDKEARAALRDLLERVGLDVEAYEIEVQEVADGDPARWVTAHQVVGGSRTGATFSATVGEEGIAWADGVLATPTSIGRYPVVSETEAVERLGDPRFASSVYPIAFAESARMDEPVADPGPGEPTPAPAPPSSGSAITWPVSNVTITEARLGLAQHQQDDGAVLVVPTYELRDAEGNMWSVIAVTEDALDFAD